MGELNLVSAVRVTNALLVSGFIAHLLLQFRYQTRRRLLWLWILYWGLYLVGFALFYLIPQVDNFQLMVAATALTYALQDFTLLGVWRRMSHGEEPESGGRALLKRVAWGVLLVLIVGAVVALPQLWSQIIANYLSFLALALYTGYWSSLIRPSPGILIPILLYIYAGQGLVAAWATIVPDSTGHILLLAINVPLKIVLYYTGYKTLTGIFDITGNSRIQREKPPRVKSVKEAKAREELPDPAVELQLTGFWAFLYLLVRYPSGKLLVLTMFASLLTATVYIAANLDKLPSLFDLLAK